ncbi:MAG: hypothetical protein J5789_07100 [Oscillospiraceae bacterium]|nr:hypothetical protein [Oscillospiraceae bacterium]
MSKKKHKTSPEIPFLENGLEVPSYVFPATDLEYRGINDEVDLRDTEFRDSKPEDCRH